MNNFHWLERHSFREVGHKDDYLSLSGWQGLSFVVWLELTPFIHSSLTCPLFIYSFIHQVFFFMSFVCHIPWTWLLPSFPFQCLSRKVIYHHIGTNKVSWREFMESHIGQVLVVKSESGGHTSACQAMSCIKLQFNSQTKKKLNKNNSCYSQNGFCYVSMNSWKKN